MSTVLAVDDDDTILFLVEQALRDVATKVVKARSGAEGLERIADSGVDVVLLDLNLPDSSGLDLLKQVRDHDRKIPVIVITAEAEAETAIEAMQLGAYDYVSKPVDFAALQDLTRRATRFRHLMKTPVALGVDGVSSADVFVGRSPAMLEVFKTIGRVASQRVPVLIRGESGSGKELVARAVYQHSDRADDSYMAINCAALPETLLESELFGHEKGAFTGADRKRIGKFEQASGGTLFLDEVGDMPPLVQAKVLRLLQEQKFERVGGNETIQTDVRIITATNRNLEAMVEVGEFREDLLYRLNGVTIRIPPVRERRSDLEPLISHFLGRSVRAMSRLDIEGVGPDALSVLLKYDWPGNVRELESVVRQAVLNCNGPVIAAEHLPAEVRAGGSSTSGAGEEETARPLQVGLGGADRVEILPPSEGGAPVSFDLAALVAERLQSDSEDIYAEVIEAAERLLFNMTVAECEGNQSRVAQRLGITRAKVRDRIAQFNISVERKVVSDA